MRTRRTLTAGIELLEVRQLLTLSAPVVTAGLANPTSMTEISLSFTNPSGLPLHLEVRGPGNPNYLYVDTLPGSRTSYPYVSTRGWDAAEYSFRAWVSSSGEVACSPDASVITASYPQASGAFTPMVIPQEIELEWGTVPGVLAFVENPDVYLEYGIAGIDVQVPAYGEPGQWVPYDTFGEGFISLFPRIGTGEQYRARALLYRLSDSLVHATPWAAPVTISHGDSLAGADLTSLGDGVYAASWPGNEVAPLDISIHSGWGGTKTLRAGLSRGTLATFDVGEGGTKTFPVYGEGVIVAASAGLATDGTLHQAGPAVLAGALPAMPTGLIATLGNQRNEIRVSWSNSADNESGYRVLYRQQGDTGSWQEATATAADISETEFTLPADYAGKLYDVRVVSFNGAGESFPATTVASGIALQSVSFGGAGRQYVMRDSGSSRYDGAQWFDANYDGQIVDPAAEPYVNNTVDGATEHRYPLSYFRSTSVMSMRLEASPVMFYAGSIGDSWKMRGEGGGYTFPAQTVASGGGWIWSSLPADDIVPATIVSGVLDVTWKLSTDGANWFEVGTSDNWLYVTGGGAADGQFETVIHLGCEGGQGNTPDTDAAKQLIADGIWGQLSGNETKRVDGTLMKYNHDGDTGSTAAKMLADATGRGRCDSWADLLVQTLGAQGVAATSVRMLPKANYDYLEVSASRAQGSGTMDYNRTIFNFHQVVKVACYPDRIYDPSYGGSPTADAVDVQFAYEKAHVVRYWQRVRHPITGEFVPGNPLDDTADLKELLW